MFRLFVYAPRRAGWDFLAEFSSYGSAEEEMLSRQVDDGVELGYVQAYRITEVIEREVFCSWQD